MIDAYKQVLVGQYEIPGNQEHVEFLEDVKRKRAAEEDRETAALIRRHWSTARGKPGLWNII